MGSTMAGNSEPHGDVSDTSTLDPESLGFMCGIEVHQQLATGKLHSRQKMHALKNEKLRSGKFCIHSIFFQSLTYSLSAFEKL